jgi:L-threonylcarbamoyladenylate synthase
MHDRLGVMKKIENMITEKDIDSAVKILRGGGVVVFPTETAYGLAADAKNAEAVEKVRDIKGRDQEKAFPVIAADMQMIEEMAGVSGPFAGLAQKHWPGALTMILPVIGEGLSPGVVRDGTVAVRISSHPVSQALSKGLGSPIVSTSANRGGAGVCYSIDCVRQQLSDEPDLYLDGGELIPEPPSTIVTVDDYGYPEVIRQGSIEI